jgi:hypothetical protein
LDLLIPLLASAIPLVLDANEEKRNPVPSNGSEEQRTGQKNKMHRGSRDRREAHGK